MKTNFKQLLVIAALALAGQASGQVILYEQGEFAGRSLIVVEPLEDFRRSDFNDSAHSVMVVDQPWQLCEDYRFQGHCVVLRQGRYPSLVAMGLSGRISSARAADIQSRIDSVQPMPAQGAAAAQVIFLSGLNSAVGLSPLTRQSLISGGRALMTNLRRPWCSAVAGRLARTRNSEVAALFCALAVTRH